MATVTVVYPKGHDFNLQYYTTKHMEIVEEHWKQYGLESWQITPLKDDNVPYQMQATLQFKSIGDFQTAATSPAAETVLGDIKNFTTAQPIIMAGEVVKSG